MFKYCPSVNTQCQAWEVLLPVRLDHFLGGRQKTDISAF